MVTIVVRHQPVGRMGSCHEEDCVSVCLSMCAHVHPEWGGEKAGRRKRAAREREDRRREVGTDGMLGRKIEEGERVANRGGGSGE